MEEGKIDKEQGSDAIAFGKQRVALKDAENMLAKMILNYKVPLERATLYDEDYAGGSQIFINESIVKELIKKLTR